MTVAPPRHQYRFLSIAEITSRLRDGLSVRDLTAAVLEGLETVGRGLNAVAEVGRESALRAAVAIDARLQKGSARPLEGVSYGVKDVFSTKDLPTRWSAPPFQDQRLQEDAAVVERLDAAGGILAGKLSSIQLAGAGGYRWPSTSLHGPGINPWGSRRWSGGSSSGPAIAVSAGLLPFAIGSETTGSVIVPAAFCGVTGLRPSWGIVSQRGMLDVAWSIDKPGVIARSARDCRTVLGEIVGADPNDPASTDWRPPDRRRRRYRIGILALSFDGFSTTGHRFEDALGVLREAGMHLREVTLPDGDFPMIVTRILAGETAASQESLVDSGAVDELLDASQRAGIRRSVRGHVAPFARALRDRVAATHAVRSIFADVDALVAPTSLSEAPGIGTDLNRWAPRRRHYGFLGALAGLPGVSVPMGLGDAGLPLGMTIMADQRCDDVALDIAEAFQRDTGWHLMRPQVAS